MVEGLDTTINVELETDNIDEAISYCNSNSAISGVGDILSDIKSTIEEASQEGVRLAAEDNKSMQELWIQQNNSIVTGNLLSSITIYQNSDTSWTVVPEADYAYYVEFGRGPVRPVSAKALHFFVEGEEVFTKYSGPSMPKPFVQPSFEVTENNNASTIIMEAINNAIN